ncbi:glycosyltransferase family 4 protein [Ancylobacter sp. IITR112]|uniref:glycosyltransferase family 4 protein n=1 Tax=Ancylobacter sp. IITR112 TaxID=3138073 RepID=UPI00352AEF92
MNASRVIIFQPTLPSYRVDLFERVAEKMSCPVEVWHSSAQLGVLTQRDERFAWERLLPPIRRLLPGLDWQSGVLTTPVGPGDVVVLSGAPRNVSNMLMLVRARWRGARTVWWGQYWSSTSRTHRFLLRLLLMKLSHAILFYTDDECEAYRNGLGRGDARPVEALNNGINVAPILAERAPYVPGQRARSLLFIGRLTEKAELGILLDALARPELADVRLEIVGDGEERAALEEKAARLGLEGRLGWHGGMTDERAIAAIANRCRLFVYPGGVGLSLLHAMAYGLPVVVHDDRWRHMPEIAAFHRARCGLTFEKDNPAALAGAISEALAVTEVDDNWSVAAARVAEKEFNTEEMARRFCRLLQRVGVQEGRHAVLS